MNGEAFLVYVEKMQASPSAQATVVIDNLSSHEAQGARSH